MFERFLYRNKIMKIVIYEYEKELPYYKSQIEIMIDSCDENTTAEEMINKNAIAVQHYYEKVFNNVSAKVSYNQPTYNFRFLTGLSSSICGYKTDPDALAAGTVYAVTYWVVTNKKADSKDCEYINHYVYDLKTKVLKELEQ